LVAGGSLGKAGAAAMAGLAVLRSGAGLATVAVPKSILPTVAGFHPELMTEPLAETRSGTISLSAVHRLSQISEGKTVVAVGPGISRVPQTSSLVRALVKKLDLPVILDADGLNAFAGRASDLIGKGKTLIITPHPGEMARLVNLAVPAVQRDRIGVARKF